MGVVCVAACATGAKSDVQIKKVSIKELVLLMRDEKRVFIGISVIKLLLHSVNCRDCRCTHCGLVFV